MICFICETDCGGSIRHIYNCAKNKFPLLSEKDVKFKQICYKSKRVFNSEDFKEYAVDGFGMPYFKSKYGLDFKSIKFLLKYFEIEIRSHKDAINNKNMKERRKTSCIEKYGEDNPSKSIVIQKKKEATFKKNYGVDNIFCSEDFKALRDSRMILKYGAKSVSNRHGRGNPFGIHTLSKEQKNDRFRRLSEFQLNKWKKLSEEERKDFITRMILGRTGSITFKSSIEDRVYRIANENGIILKRQFFVCLRPFDFCFHEKKILIEINGDFWHANPNKYKSDQKLKHPGKEVVAQDLWNKDLERKKLAESYGYRVFYIWESSIRGSTDSDILLELRRIINEN